MAPPAKRHCLAYQDMAWGILPLGTTDNSARTLGIPLDVPGAVGVLAAGKVADVDLGDVHYGMTVDVRFTGRDTTIHLAQLVSSGIKHSGTITKDHPQPAGAPQSP